jgi:hypothetical protein
MRRLDVRSVSPAGRESTMAKKKKDKKDKKSKKSKKK